MARYLLAEARGQSQNRFVASFAAELDLLSQSDISCDIIIDTGCSLTKLMASSFGGFIDYHSLHEEDINNYKTGKLGLVPSYGTTDTARNLDLKCVSDDLLRSDPRICFGHNLASISVNGYSFGSFKELCKVGYIKSGSSLLGMNILNQMDFHCGHSKILNKFVFIGCLRSDINIDYVKALAKHLGYLPNTNFMKYLIKNGVIDKEDLFIRKNYDLTK